MRVIRIVDSHTGGEPTRVVIDGGPDLLEGHVGPAPTMAQRLERFRDRFDHFRSAVVNEPRGSDVMVGALLCESVDPESACGVIFFNNVGYLGMCGHGLIGVIATLSRLGRIGPGEHRVETPVGTVTAVLEVDGVVRFENVPSFRKAKGVEIAPPPPPFRRPDRLRRRRLGRQLVLPHRCRRHPARHQPHRRTDRACLAHP